jgi:hypothetical protein
MMSIILFIVFGAITAFLAKRKGYNPYIWFFAAGVIGLIVLAFLPYTDVETLDDGQKKAAKKKGNIIAGVIVALVVIFTTASFFFLRWEMAALESKTQKIICKMHGDLINIALSSYYAKTGTRSPSSEPSFPSSLHDADFQTNFFDDGKLPERPCGKDWNDFYNSIDGKLNVTAACDCRD